MRYMLDDLSSLQISICMIQLSLCERLILQLNYNWKIYKLT